MRTRWTTTRPTEHSSRPSRGGPRRTLPRAALALAAATLLASCATPSGSTGDPAGPGSTSDDPTTPGAAADPARLAGQVTILQQGDGPVMLCLGGVMESYPPQCGGPELLDFAWEDAPESESASGTTWASGFVVVTPVEGGYRLLEPLSATPPEGYPEPEARGPDFPELCEDPYRGGDETADAGAEALAAMVAAAETLPDYALHYVSDGAEHYNVIVTQDAEAAHAALREVWPGWLCVAQRDVPTQAAMTSASDALSGLAEDLDLLHWGGGGVDGVLEVGVPVADEATVAAIHEAVSAWLTSDQVRIHAALAPLPAT